MSNGDKRAYEYIIKFRHYTHKYDSPAGVAADLNLLQNAIKEVRLYLIDAMRDEGWSWEQVGQALGTSRQAARALWERGQ